MDLLGTNGDGRYRVVVEDQIVQWLIFVAWPFEARDDPDRAKSNAIVALARLVALGLPYRHEGRSRLFDFCEVTNFWRREGLVGREPTYREQAVPAARRMTLESMGQTEPSTSGSREHDPRQFVLSLRREFNLEGKVPGTLVRLRLPLPYDDATQREIQVEVMGSRSPEAQVNRRSGYLEFRLPVPADHTPVGIEARVAFTALRQSCTLGLGGQERTVATPPDSEIEPYLRPSEGMIKVTPTIIDLANALAGRNDAPWDIVQFFWTFFFDRMRPGYIHHNELDRLDPLGDLVRRGWFDCLTGSSLLVGLCRARGIPARVVNGVMLYDPTPSFHYWAEVLIPTQGWVPLDLICWELAAGELRSLPWSRLLLGGMDYRLKCQRFPHQVTGPIGMPFPSSWFMLMAPTSAGTEMSYYSLEPLRLLYRDLLSVTRQPAGPQESDPAAQPKGEGS